MGGQCISALVDTGSSLSLISPIMARSLPTNPIDPIHIRIANGQLVPVNQNVFPPFTLHNPQVLSPILKGAFPFLIMEGLPYQWRH